MGLRIDAAVYSHIGGRKNNEDNFFLNGLYMEREQMNQGGQYHTEFTDTTQIYAICDGMGGAEFGEEASLLAVKSLKKYLTECEQPDNSEFLCDMVAETSRGIDQISFAHNMPSGASGSTLAMLILSDWYFRTVNVGDSRIYRLRGGRLERITKDHSEVQRLIDNGQITPAQAWQHPQKNVITKHLGMPTRDGRLIPTISPRMDLYPGDRYLICSDGLSDVVHDTRIEQILKENRPSLDTAGLLVRTALDEADRMGIQSDNVSIIMLDVQEVGRRGNAEKKVRTLKLLQKLSIGGMAACGVGLLFVIIDIIKFLLK